MVEVDDQYIFLAVIRNHSVADDDQHQVENGIEMFLDIDVKVKHVHAHDHYWSKLFVMSVGIYLPFFELG